MNKFSLYLNGITNVTPDREIDIKEFLGMLKEPNPIVEKVREMVKAGATKDEKNKVKRDLSYVTFGGTFTKRANDELKESSEYACFDLDDIENLEEVKEQVKQNKYTHCLFVSPSGKGYKFIVKIPKVKGNEEYRQHWISIEQHYNLPSSDTGTKDIARACYMSVDKEPYFNPNSEVYTDKVEVDLLKKEWEKAKEEQTEENKDTSRSARDYREVCKLIGQNKKREEVFNEMEAFAKWSSSPEQYKETTYNKAKKFIEDSKDKDTDIKQFLIPKGINKKTGKQEHSVNIDKASKHIEDTFNVRTIYGLKEEILEIYNEGIWTPTGKGVVKAAVEKLLKSYSKNNVVSEILEKIKRRTEVTRKEADNIPDYKRCLINGVLDLEDEDNIQLLEHSKEYNFRNKFPINYDPNADCPNIKKFFKQTFYEEDIPLVLEWIGFHLVRRYLFKKLMIAHGEKNTGKTIFLNLLTEFLGDNVSGLSIQEISHAKPFDLIALKNKDGNICDDLSSSDMTAVGGIKMSVGDGWINGEHKFGDKDRFRNTAKNTNACNKIPNPGEDIDDEAYYERIILLPIDNIVPKEHQDKKLIDKLTTPKELSGLLNLAIEGYRRLIKQNGFSNAKTPEETKFLMVQNGNSLARFASDALIHKDGEKVTKEIMYQVYCKWCMNHKPKLSPDTKDKIGKNLSKFAPYTQASSNGAKRYWLNVKINDTYDTFQNNMSSDLEHSNMDNSSSKNKRYDIFEPVIPVINNDTYDTNSKKDIIKQNKEVLDKFEGEIPEELQKEIDTLDTNSKKELDNTKPEVEVVKIK